MWINRRTSICLTIHKSTAYGKRCHSNAEPARSTITGLPDGISDAYSHALHPGLLPAAHLMNRISEKFGINPRCLGPSRHGAGQYTKNALPISSLRGTMP